MPNHITNIITADAEVIDFLAAPLTDAEVAEALAQVEVSKLQLREQYQEEWAAEKRAEIERNEPRVDFNRVTPMPSEVEGTTVGTGGVSAFSTDGWYGWSVQNWGTKWNAYESSVETLGDGRKRVRFDTAWSHPGPIMQALAKRFPDKAIEVEYADEDLGANLGTYRIEGGEIVDLVQPDHRENPDAALAMAVRIKYGQTLEDYKAERLADELDSAWRWVMRKRIEARTGEDPGWNMSEDIDDDIKQAITTEEQAESVWADDSELLNKLVNA